MKLNKHIFYFIICMLLAVVANLTLFYGPIGISYSILLVFFYSVFFYQHKSYPFSQKRISGLIFFSIMALALMYFIFSNPVFNIINYALLPLLVYVHTNLLTSPIDLHWHKPTFYLYMKSKTKKFFSASNTIMTVTTKKLRRNVGDSTYGNAKKIGIGLIFAAPLLFIVINLLFLADAQFANLLLSIPELLLQMNTSFFWDLIRILLLFFVFFCFFKVIGKRTVIMEYERINEEKKNWDTVVVSTVLITLNLIYLLFTIVQFQYFFSGGSTGTLTYAEYARRGFFELMTVTIINYVTLATTLRFSKKGPASFVKIQLTLLILFSSIMLTSAFMRLMMYEQAFGYTYQRIFAHAFMVYLIVIFAFTLVKVWAYRLSLARFYILFTLLFYLGLNVINIDSIIVEKNIERYEATGKIDIEYLGSLSYSAVPALVELYDSEPENKELERVLEEKQANLADDRWQSFNLSRENAKRALKNTFTK
ncbi:DUF4153 domain-containing protein [Evansella sp. AB-rgal1]|uniref:DUF4153 domain-containing protein n=1 Tax=Evansella sp. AB-rgal1 TaxID=3242696 RepID=UPI00359F0891